MRMRSNGMCPRKKVIWRDGHKTCCSLEQSSLEYRVHSVCTSSHTVLTGKKTPPPPISRGRICSMSLVTILWLTQREYKQLVRSLDVSVTSGIALVVETYFSMLLGKGLLAQAYFPKIFPLRSLDFFHTCALRMRGRTFVEQSLQEVEEGLIGNFPKFILAHVVGVYAKRCI